MALLHIVNSLEIPVSLTKSHSCTLGCAGCYGAMVVRSNAVGFFPTAGLPGMMYYFVPANGVPVFSYRLSVVHFGR